MRRKGKRQPRPNQVWCPKCHNPFPRLTKHHVYPLRWYRGKRGHRHIQMLCAGCHKDIELILEHYEFIMGGGIEKRQLPDSMYPDINRLFVSGQLEKVLLFVKGRRNV